MGCGVRDLQGELPPTRLPGRAEQQGRALPGSLAGAVGRADLQSWEQEVRPVTPARPRCSELLPSVCQPLLSHPRPGHWSEETLGVRGCQERALCTEGPCSFLWCLRLMGAEALLSQTGPRPPVFSSGCSLPTSVPPPSVPGNSPLLVSVTLRSQ